MAGDEPNNSRARPGCSGVFAAVKSDEVLICSELDEAYEMYL